MLGIFSSVAKTATRMDAWSAPDHWSKSPRGPRSERELIELDRRRSALHHRFPW